MHGSPLRSLGDKYRPDYAQKSDKYSSCVLRITKNGGVPSGNLPAHVKPKECWAHGLRNGYTSSWDLYPKGKERYLIAEVGGNRHSRSQEDVHIGTKGANFGWPHCEGNCNNPKFPSCSCKEHDDPVYTMFHDNKAYDPFGARHCYFSRHPFVIEGIAYRHVCSCIFFKNR